MAAKIEECHPAFAEESVVARVRIRIEQPVTPEGSEHESREGRAGGVSVGAGRALAERRVVDAPHELERQDPLARERVHHARKDDVRVARVDAPERVDRLGFERVVRLGEEHALDLVERLLGPVAPSDGGDQRLEHRETLQVVLDRLGDARVLDLDRDLFPGVRHGSMDLADARGRERLALPLGEQLARIDAEVRANDLDRGLGGKRRRVLLKSREDALEPLLVAGGREAVDVRRHLPELEREPLHLAERLEQHLGRLLRALQEAPAGFGLVLLGAVRPDGAANGLGSDRKRPGGEGSQAGEAAEARNGRGARARSARSRRCTPAAARRQRRRHGASIRCLRRNLTVRFR